MFLQLEENKFRWLPQQKPSGARGQNWHARSHKYLAAAPGSWNFQKPTPASAAALRHYYNVI